MTSLQMIYSRPIWAGSRFYLLNFRNYLRLTKESTGLMMKE